MESEKTNILKIIWYDSHHISGWSKIKNLPPCSGKKTISVGLEIQNTDEAITLALSYGNNLPQVQGVIIIPKTAIESIQVITIINLKELL